MTMRNPTLTAFALALAMGAAACSQGNGAPSHDSGPPVPVSVRVAAYDHEPSRIDLSGELVARDRVEVASKIAGRITDLPVTEGTPVRAGDVLARLDSPELASALVQSQAAEDAARLARETAERQAARMKRLAAEDVVTPHDLEMAEVAAAGAVAAHERARSMTEMSRRNLDYAVLRAPRSGVVVKRLARAGDLATPGRPLVVIEDPAALEVRVTLPAELRFPVAPGAKALVEGPLAGGGPVPATVSRVTPGAESHTLEAYLQVDGLSAPSGSFVQATVFGPDSVRALRVDDDAVVRRGPLTGVFIVRDGRAALHWIRLAGDGEVLAGVAPGDSVIAAPSADLEDGDRVEVAR